MFARVSLLTAALATSVCSVGQAFVTPRASTHSALTRAGGIFSSGRLASSVSPRTATASGTFHRGCFEPRMSAQIDIRDLCLTPVLEQMTKAFSMAPTPRTRHEQLLAMGGSAAKMAPEYKTEENKVQGWVLTTINFVVLGVCSTFSVTSWGVFLLLQLEFVSSACATRAPCTSALSAMCVCNGFAARV